MLEFLMKNSPLLIPLAVGLYFLIGILFTIWMRSYTDFKESGGCVSLVGIFFWLP